jgi:hypothetical protein
VAIRMERSRLASKAAQGPEAIEALADLLTELDRHAIRYCSWKSNEHLSEALMGRTDLDLLIDPAHAARFREIVERAGIKSLVHPPRAWFPGMQHLLGIDRPSGCLFHLHVHELLVVGERFVKNHHLPLEADILDSASLLDGVPVPSAELELGILVARSLLKYRARDVVKDILKIRTPGLPSSTRTEIDWLLAQTTSDRVAAALRATGNIVPAGVAREFLEAYQKDPREGMAFLRLRGRLRWRLRLHQRRSKIRAIVTYSATTWARRRRFRRRPPEIRMQPATGGLTIGIVGPDGSGKTTIATDLERWLGWKLQVRRYYLGSKQPSRASRWSYLAFRVLRRSRRSASGSRLVSSFAEPIARARDLVLAFHHLSIGLDRRRRYRAGSRDAASGRVVIFDRFPLAFLGASSDHHLLDGPLIRSTITRPMGRVMRALAQGEERMYGGYRLPTHLVVLEVSPDVAITRKPDHRPEVISIKVRAMGELATLAENRGGSLGVVRIDANQPLSEVRRGVRSSVWDALWRDRQDATPAARDPDPDRGSR